MVVNEKRTHTNNVEEASENQNSNQQSDSLNASNTTQSNIAGYSQNEIDRLTNLVRGVVGYQEKRGDVVTLMPTSFYEDPPLPWYKDPITICLLYTSPSPRDRTRSRMPSSA